MTDPRVEKMARVIADYSLALAPGQLVLLTGEPAGYPLLRAVYELAIRAGAHPEVKTLYPELDEIRLREGNDAQLLFLSEAALFEAGKIDARLYVRAPDNVRTAAGVDPARQVLVSRGRKPLLDRYMERRVRGELASCLTQYPTDGLAQLAGMSLAEYEQFVFRACFVDRDDPVGAWRELSRRQQRYVDRLDRARELRFEAPDTDLTVSVAGRKWINSDGKANFPSGEVFTSPVEESARGIIRFDMPALFHGQSVEGILLEFRDGVVVSSRAERGGEFLERMLGTDQGASRLGEVAFGLNYGITRATGSILFDEKIGGTIHLALGACYPQTGGSNQSAIHWDMIRSMTPGRVFADGEVIYEDGRFRE